MDFPTLLALPGILLATLPFLWILQRKLNHQTTTSPPPPPGSLGWPLIGETVTFLRHFMLDPKGLYEFIRRRHEKYGRSFKTHILGTTHVFTANEKAAKQVLSGEEAFRFKIFSSFINVMGEEAVLFPHGEKHRKLRRLVGDLLTINQMKNYQRKIEEIALDTLNKWPQGTPFQLIDETTVFAFRVISSMLLSIHNGPEFQEMYHEFEIITAGMITLPFNLPGTPYYKALKARQRLLSLFSKIIDRRRSGQETGNDFLQSVLFPASEDEKLSDKQVKDNLIGLVVGGHDLSASSLMWAMKYLAENPPVLEKLRVEHLDILKKKSANAPLTWEETSNMPYTLKVINETLRMASVAQYVQRQAFNDAEIDGFQVKKGWNVAISFRAIHHDPRSFPEPEKFNPDRFDNLVNPHAFLPFGAGSRLCLGINLVKLEFCIFLHHLVTKYRWSLVDHDNSFGPSFIPKPKNGCPIIINPIDT